MKNFLFKFNFIEENFLKIGIERECHLVDRSGEIVPLAEEILTNLPTGLFGYELSACQVESRIGPCNIAEVREELDSNERKLDKVLAKKMLRKSYFPVGSDDMPLDVYPDPRYIAISNNLPKKTLAAACQVLGTHIHVGMPNHVQALKVYNSLIPLVEKLCREGDLSGGRRLELYREMEPDNLSPRYDSWKDFFVRAKQKGFDENPRNCWDLIRISIHGTIEFRMFDSTDDIDKIVYWAKLCHFLCS